MNRCHHFSPGRQFRYTLWRQVDLFMPGVLMVIGLNPSTADEVNDDATLRKCMGFAWRWNCGTLCMANLFAWRDTDPAKMMAASDPVGPDNDRHLLECAGEATMILAAWGTHGSHQGRAAAVVKLLQDRPLHCLGTNQDGSPKHPLYVPYDTPATLLFTR